MDSCLILRATLVGILLLGLLTPAQTAGYLGSVKRGCQAIKPPERSNVKDQNKLCRCENERLVAAEWCLGSVKRGYNYQGMKKQADPERKDHLGGQDLQALEPKDDVGSLVPQANRQGRTGAKNGPGLFGKKRHTSYF